MKSHQLVDRPAMLGWHVHTLRSIDLVRIETRCIQSRVRVSSIRQNRTMINMRWPRSEDVQHVLMSSES